METFQKRQKAFARKEKQQKKLARKIERRQEKTKQPEKPGSGDAPTGERPTATIL